MGRQERIRKIDRPLRKAGLEVLDGGVPDAPLPIRAVGLSSNYGPEPGVRCGFAEYGAPDLIERSNRQWYELAVSFGLFNGDREFLLALPAITVSVRQLKQHNLRWDTRPVRRVWRRVRLLERWDIFGAGAGGFLGVFPGHPGFFMLSLDESAAIVGTTWQDGVGCIAIPDPAGRQHVRDYLQMTAAGQSSLAIDAWEQPEAQAYLQRKQRRSGVDVTH